MTRYEVTYTIRGKAPKVQEFYSLFSIAEFLANHHWWGTDIVTVIIGEKS